MTTFQTQGYVLRGERPLGQIRPPATGAHPIPPPDKGRLHKYREIIVCNTTATAANYFIWLDVDGAEFDDNTLLFDTVRVDGNSTVIVPVNWTLRGSMKSSAAVGSDTASAINFTIMGWDEPEPA